LKPSRKQSCDGDELCETQGKTEQKVTFTERKIFTRHCRDIIGMEQKYFHRFVANLFKTTEVVLKID